jgi:hypothetical protein
MRFVAELVERDCGATTNYARHVILDKTGLAGLFTRKESVFVVDGQVPISISWDTNSHGIEISYDGGRVFRRDQKWGDIVVRYVDRAALSQPDLQAPSNSPSDVGPKRPSKE